MTLKNMTLQDFYDLGQRCRSMGYEGRDDFYRDSVDYEFFVAEQVGIDLSCDYRMIYEFFGRPETSTGLFFNFTGVTDEEKYEEWERNLDQVARSLTCFRGRWIEIEIDPNNETIFRFTDDDGETYDCHEDCEAQLGFGPYADTDSIWQFSRYCEQ